MYPGTPFSCTFLIHTYNTVHFLLNATPGSWEFIKIIPYKKSPLAA